MAQPELQGTNNLFKDGVKRGPNYFSWNAMDDRITRLEGDLALAKTSITELEKGYDEVLMLLKTLNDKFANHQKFGHKTEADKK